MPGIKLDEKEWAEPNRENLPNQLSETARAFENCKWKGGYLYALLGCSTQLFLLSETATSLVYNCYVFGRSRKEYVNDERSRTGN